MEGEGEAGWESGERMGEREREETGWRLPQLRARRPTKMADACQRHKIQDRLPHLSPTSLLLSAHFSAFSLQLNSLFAQPFNSNQPRIISVHVMRV